MSALDGDNVVDRSANMAWYEGSTLLNHLETVYFASDSNLIDARFPVQYVIRPQTAEHRDYRGYAGQVAAGVLRPGDDVVVLPSGFPSTITSIDTPDGPVDEARPPMAVTIRLADEVDISPRRHDLPARTTSRTRRRTSRRWCAGWTRRASLAPRQTTRSSTRPGRCGRW